MTDNTSTYKYWAFISYSHRDKAWAEWLQNGLESWRAPRRLAGKSDQDGLNPKRLAPVFRDISELPSSSDLGGVIDEALIASRYMIVICSPHAASSRWVNQEIVRFRALGRADRILCLIVEGEPNVAASGRVGLPECFPPALRDGSVAEPIAADVRGGRQAKPIALLKLIAGLLNVGLDDLIQREQARIRTKRLLWLSAALLIAAAFGSLWKIQQNKSQLALARQIEHARIEKLYEDGRAELIARNNGRAAVLLNEVYKSGVDTPALRYLLARAMKAVDAEIFSIHTGSPIAKAELSRDILIYR